MWRQTGLYMLSSVGGAAVSFAGTALFTRLYSPVDYGVYITANALGGIVSAMLFTWVRLSVLRVEARGDGSDVRLTALTCYAGSAACLALLAPLLRYAAGLPWTVSAGACLFAGTIALFELQLEILRARQRVGAYALASAGRAVLMVGAGFAIAGVGLGGFGLSLSIAFAYAGVSLGLAPAVWSGSVAPFDRAAARAMLRFGLPATLSALAMALHAATDRLFVTHLLGVAAGGQYGVAADLTRQIVLVPVTALGSALVPAAIACHAGEGVAAARRQLAASGEMLLGLLLPLVVGLSLVGPQVAALVLGPRFQDAAATLIPVLSFVWLFQAVSQNYVHVGFHVAGRSSGMVAQALVSLAVNFALIVPATLWFGILGAAAAVLAAEAVGAVAGFFLARRHFPLPFAAGGLARVVLATAVMAAAVRCVGFALPASVAAVPAGALAARVVTGVVVYGAGVVLLDLAGVGSALGRRLGRGDARLHQGGFP